MIFLRQWTHALNGSTGGRVVGGRLDDSTTPATEDNGLERTPVLGWSSWSFLRKEPTADQVEAQALALQNSGLQKIGYQLRKP